MTRKSTLTVLFLALAASLLLTACGSGPVREVYSASGDINDPDKLTKTSTFRTDDDLNIVVTLNSHNRTLSLYAVFTAPDGTEYRTDVIDATQTAGTVILGLDWELAGSLPWIAGQWSVVLFVDDEQESSLKFDVSELPAAAPAG